MKRLTLLPITIALGWVAVPQASANHAWCINEDTTAVLEQESAPNNQSFVGSGPARADTELEIMFDLSNINESEISPDEASPEISETMKQTPETETVTATAPSSRQAYLDAVAVELSECLE